jgi:hypothetical protein
LAIAQTLRDLHEVSIESSHLSDAFVEALVSKHRNLTKLHLSGATNQLSDRALSLIQLHCQKLRSLTIRVPTARFSPAATDSLIKALRGLTYFSFKGCPEFTDPMVEALTSSLESLSLSGCRSLTKDGIAKLASRCQKLSRVNLQDCPDPSSISQTLEGLKATKPNFNFNCQGQVSLLL